MKEQIEALLAQVQDLQSKVTPPDRDAEIAALRKEAADASCLRARVERERDLAVKELADLKASIAWTMDKLQIRDMFRAKSEIEDIPASAEGWLPFTNDFQDTPRLEFINHHGRVGVGQHNQFVIVLPSKVPLMEETIPEIYNIRHIIDICRKSNSAAA